MSRNAKTPEDKSGVKKESKSPGKNIINPELGSAQVSAHQFFNILFQPDEIGVPAYITLWRRDNKLTMRFKVSEIEKAAAYAEKVGTKTDIYVGCALQPKDDDPSIRGKAATVCAIPGVWVDLDVGEKENGKTYFPSQAEALAFIREQIEIQPTIIVATDGDDGGLHLWWLFDELFLIKNQADRSKAETLAHSWQCHLKTQMKKLRFDLDSTHDLARVLRIPGTKNFKNGRGEVKVIECDDGRRYSSSDLTDIAGRIPTETVSQEVARTAESVIGSFTIDQKPDRTVLIKVDALRVNDSRFAKTWKRTRTDLSDTSASAYEMAIMNVAYVSGWSAQEIIDACRLWRIEHELEATHEKAYACSLENVAKSRGRDRQEAQTQRAIENAVAVGVDTSDATDRTNALESISDRIGCRVSMITRTKTVNRKGVVEGVVYAFTIRTLAGSEEQIVLDASAVMEKKKFAQAVFEVAGVDILRTTKPLPYAMLVTIIGQVAIDVVGDVESSPTYVIETALREYLSEGDFSTSLYKAKRERTLWRDGGGNLWLALAYFMEWFSISPDRREFTRPHLTRCLRDIGLEPDTVESDGIRERRWMIPKWFDTGIRGNGGGE